MTSRYLALTLATLALSLPISAHAEHPKELPQPTISSNQTLVPEDRNHLLNDTFTVVKTVDEIPAPVRNVLIPEHTNPLDGMANPGKRYQVTDVVGPERLPFRRLILAASSAGYSLIYDEHGGFGYYQLLSLYRLTGGGGKLVWSGYVRDAPGFLNFDRLRALIRERKHRDIRPTPPWTDAAPVK